MPQTFNKDPDARLDYKEDWTAWLDGDTITGSEWIVPDGITEDGTSFDDTTATIWLKDGTLGGNFQVTNRITTAGARINDRTITVRIRQQ
jgi:hypothetical protein